jgi:protocatechuate 4,5-dioxygenase, beta chain
VTRRKEATVAELVQLVGVTHNPFLPRLFKQPDPHPGIRVARAGYERLREQIAAARPDVLLVVASDHFNQWFTDNMPAFMIGKAPWAEGPFPWEEAGWGLAHYRTRIDVDLARCLVGRGFDAGVDLAFSDEFVVDHSFTMPLSYLRPEADLPIVPLFTNVMAPPVASSRRFYQVGEALAAVIRELPASLRVAVIASGHLSVEIGGPKTMHQWQGAADAEFDSRVTELVRAGDVEGLLRETTWERMQEAGNVTSGFLNFVLLVGLSQGRPATHAECVFANSGTSPFYAWDLHRETAP